MIISGGQVQSILKLYAAPFQKNDNVDNVSAVKTDSLELSDRARELKLAEEMALKSPDVRVDKVNELKKRIKEGTYHVSTTDIAEKMVERSLVDELVRR